MAKTGQMSVVKSLDNQEAAAVPYFAPYIKQLQTAKPRPAVPQEPQIDTALQNDLTPAFQGKHQRAGGARQGGSRRSTRC